MKNITKWTGIVISVFCAIMIAWHWNDHEVSAWIIGFTGWFNYTLDIMKEVKNEQV